MAARSATTAIRGQIGESGAERRSRAARDATYLDELGLSSRPAGRISRKRDDHIERNQSERTQEPSASPKGKQVGNEQAVATLKANAERHAENLSSIVDDLKARGVVSVRAIAAELNARGVLTPHGGAWHPTSTARLLARLDE